MSPPERFFRGNRKPLAIRNVLRVKGEETRRNVILMKTEEIGVKGGKWGKKNGAYLKYKLVNLYLFIKLTNNTHNWPSYLPYNHLTK